MSVGLGLVLLIMNLRHFKFKIAKVLIQSCAATTKCPVFYAIFSQKNLYPYIFSFIVHIKSVFWKDACCSNIVHNVSLFNILPTIHMYKPFSISMARNKGNLYLEIIQSLTCLIHILDIIHILDLLNVWPAHTYLCGLSTQSLPSLCNYEYCKINNKLPGYS